MGSVDYGKVLEAIRLERFTLFQCIDYLRKYGDNIAVHHTVVARLRTYSYDDLEFFIPQFIQLLVTYETNLMALEDFLLDYCGNYPHFSLVVFWNLQAYVWELRNDPELYLFQTVRKFINKLQNIMFTTEPLPRSDDFKENLHPALMLCAAFAALVAMPGVGSYINPIVKLQLRQEKLFVFKLANFQKTLTKNLTLKNRKQLLPDPDHDAEPKRLTLMLRVVALRETPELDLEVYTTDDELRNELSKVEGDRLHLAAYLLLETNLKINTVIKLKKKRAAGAYPHNSQLLPDLSAPESPRPSLAATESEYTLDLKRTLSGTAPGPKPPSYDHLVRVLKVNYAKQATDFVMALQNISLRLLSVPKEARLLALRAELLIINDSMLPSEVDIPQLLPITSLRNKKYHKILRLLVNEACVLNLAARVPFLLLVEYLSDEVDFNPFLEYNQRIIGGTAGDEHVPKLPLAGSADSTFDEVAMDETDLVDIPRMLRLSSSNTLNKLGTEGADIIGQMENRLALLLLALPDIGSKHLADQMRIALVMLQQLELLGQLALEHSLAIRNRIVELMILLQDQFDAIDYAKLNEMRGDEQDAGERKLENDFKLGEDWATKRLRIKKLSKFGHLPNWELCLVIAKNGDDLPQEAFACQLITLINNIWKRHRAGGWTKRMRILITLATTGLVETITNAMLIHLIKKLLTELLIATGDNAKGRIVTLGEYYEKLFGAPDSRRYKQAQMNFAKLLASYSIICYVLQIKDRHNGNIMVDSEGHIIHIDFGFLLLNSPGSVGFEAAPFKLTQEYIDLLGGPDSSEYAHFRTVCKNCFKSLRREGDQLVSIVELMQRDLNLPCFNNGENTSVLLKQRLQMELLDDESDVFVDGLIAKSAGSMYTRLYDQFQMVTQGIYY